MADFIPGIRVAFIFDEERIEGTIFKNLGNDRFGIIGTDGNQYEIKKKSLYPISCFSNENPEKKEPVIIDINLIRTLDTIKSMVEDSKVEVRESVINHEGPSEMFPGRHSIQIEIILKETE